MQSTFSLSLFLVLCGDVGDRLIVHLLSFLPRGCNSPVSGSVGKASEKKKVSHIGGIHSEENAGDI